LSVTLLASVFAITPKAFAGEGGIAGAASFNLDPDTGTFVLEASTAIAVGKTSAYALSNTTGTDTQALATGTGGAITLTDGILTGIAEETGLGTAQANELDAQLVKIDALSGTNSVEN
jgi:hypothetical protein